MGRSNIRIPNGRNAQLMATPRIRPFRRTTGGGGDGPPPTSEALLAGRFDPSVSSSLTIADVDSVVEIKDLAVGIDMVTTRPNRTPYYEGDGYSGLFPLPVLRAYRRQTIETPFSLGDVWSIGVMAIIDTFELDFLGRYVLFTPSNMQDTTTVNDGPIRVNSVAYASGAYDYALHIDEPLIVENDAQIVSTRAHYSDYNYGTSPPVIYGELLVYVGAPTEPEKTAIREWLALKWGVPLSP